MAESPPKLEITAKVVDLGDKVIQLQHVVSAGRDATHPLRPAGIVLAAVGIGVIGREVMTAGATAFALAKGGSLPLWIGFGALGISLFFLLFARRQLALRTSDGTRVVLPAESEEEAAEIVMRLRLAMEGAGGGVLVPALAATPPQALPHAAVPAESAQLTPRTGAPLGLPPQQAGPASRHPGGEHAQPQTMPLGKRADLPYANGHAARSPQSGMPDVQGFPFGEGAGAHRTQPAHHHQIAAQATPAAERRHAPAGEAAGQPSSLREALASQTAPAGPVRDEAPADLAQLMEHVRRSDVQHKEALLDLLRVVEDYYNGRSGREDAVAHWRSFADYVKQYLTDVDGLVAHADRFGRHLQPR